MMERKKKVRDPSPQPTFGLDSKKENSPAKKKKPDTRKSGVNISNLITLMKSVLG